MLSSKKFLIFSLLFIGLQSIVCADWRPYAYSYSYLTAYQGEREIELYTDYDFKDSTYTLKNQLELEYGITDHWMASIYGVFKSTQSSTYQFDQTKLQTRLRFGETDQFILDPAVYVEYKIPASGAAHALELKQILSKDINDWNITTNLVAEKELAAGKDWSYAYTLGLSRMLRGNLRAGLETKGSFGNNPIFYLAPSIAVIFGEIKMNLAAGFGLTAASKTMYIRNIFSYEF